MRPPWRRLLRGTRCTSWWPGFITGMLSAQVAALFTNPIDVVKIRLQIQGEAAASTAAGVARGGKAARPIGTFGWG